MTNNTNFGALLKKGATTIAQVVNIDFPGVVNAAVEATSHSDTYRGFVAGKLKEVESFDVEIAYDPVGVTHNGTAGLLADVKAGTAATYSIVFPDTAGTTWSFSAIPTKFKAQAADAKSPDALRATVSFRPTGLATLA